MNVALGMWRAAKPVPGTGTEPRKTANPGASPTAAKRRERPSFKNDFSAFAIRA
ncbi:MULTISPECIES: hypothetical protein [Fibrobacter]|uniref:hypothetical protein n=1 Tax=Fibrobacter TaxID=832 RepID=UPI001303F751|nr:MULTISPECIES: hypothetical protein [Fibrobacter]